MSDEFTDHSEEVEDAEIDSEHRWDMLFDDSQELLARLATEALAEHRAGKTRRLDLDRLLACD